MEVYKVCYTLYTSNVVKVIIASDNHVNVIAFQETNKKVTKPIEVRLSQLHHELVSL